MSNDELAKREQAGALAVGDFGEDAGGGFENQTMADKTVPFLVLLQDGSPQVKKRDVENYIEGAEPGHMINSVTNELYNGEEGLIFLCCMTEHCFVEWVPRDKGGGFRGKHAVGSPIVVKAQQNAQGRKLTVPVEGGGANELIETFYMYGLTFKPKIDLRKGYPDTLAEMINLDEMGSPLLVACTSTKITKYKRIMTNIGMFKLPGLPHPQNQPPLWTFPIHITSVFEKREAGDSFNFEFNFAGPKIEQDRLLPRLKAEGQEWAAYTAGREMKNAARGNTLQINFDQQAKGASSGGGGSKGSGGDDVPF